jgi:hypothetical protein
MTGTTFATSWCVCLRRCAVAGHDFRKTLIQTIKTRANVPVLIDLDNVCAPKRFMGIATAIPRSCNLVHELTARTALVLF